MLKKSLLLGYYWSCGSSYSFVKCRAVGIRYHPLLLRRMWALVGNTTEMFELLVLGILYVHSDYSSSCTENGDRRCHDHMVVGFTTTCSINAYHH